MNPDPTGDRPQPVLLFDAECRLCRGVVAWMLRHDRKGSLRFGALQGPSARRYLESQGMDTEDFDTLVFVPDWSAFERHRPLLRTSGALAAVRELGSPWAWTALLRWVPAHLRDAVYRAVSRSRKRLPVSEGWARIDAPEWAHRFLESPGKGGAA